MRRTDWFTSFGQDVVYALRGARRAPGFSLVVLLTLGPRHRRDDGDVQRRARRAPPPAPVPRGRARRARLAREPRRGRGSRADSQTELDDWARELRGFAAVGAFQELGNGLVYGDGVGEPTYAKTTYVSAGFFPALGTRRRSAAPSSPASTARREPRRGGQPRLLAGPARRRSGGDRARHPPRR
jgi:hypothetical protein